MRKIILFDQNFMSLSKEKKFVIFFTERKKLWKKHPYFIHCYCKSNLIIFFQLSKKYLLQDSNLGLWLYATMLQLLSYPDDIHITIHANVTFPIFSIPGKPSPSDIFQRIWDLDFQWLTTLIFFSDSSAIIVTNRMNV